jgi:hypothetical protein
MQSKVIPSPGIDLRWKSFDLSKKSSRVRAWDGQKDVLSLASDVLDPSGLPEGNEIFD